MEDVGHFSYLGSNLSTPQFCVRIGKDKKAVVILRPLLRNRIINLITLGIYLKPTSKLFFLIGPRLLKLNYQEDRTCKSFSTNVCGKYWTSDSQTGLQALSYGGGLEPNGHRLYHKTTEIATDWTYSSPESEQRREAGTRLEPSGQKEKRATCDMEKDPERGVDVNLDVNGRGQAGSTWQGQTDNYCKGPMLHRRRRLSTCNSIPSSLSYRSSSPPAPSPTYPIQPWKM